MSSATRQSREKVLPDELLAQPATGAARHRLDADAARRQGASPVAGVEGGLDVFRNDLIRVLRDHAVKRPHRPAFVYLLDGQAETSELTYEALDRRARAIGARLQDMALAGKRVLLAYPHGLDFIAGFFGCLYAGCTVVPTYLPHNRTLDRFRTIATDSGASLVLSTTQSETQYQSTTAMRNGGKDSSASIPWLATDEIPDNLAEQWTMPVIDIQSLAILQYTSGSTGQPKGVMLSHANLIHNARAIYQAFGVGNETGVFWLPTYHDMGLVGGVLEPMLAGQTSVLMAPGTFLQRPVAWLAAITKYRATISGGPNFAYDLCARKITDEQRAALDLSCWSLAFIGAEPIAADTLERFAEAFAPCGFDAKAFYPCYGLAEATLLVSGAARGRGPTIEAFDSTALAEGSVLPAPDDAANVRRLVSCGAPVGDQRVRIVDSQACTLAMPDRVGEIWVAGASVGRGYWQKPDPTRRSFRACLSSPSRMPGDMTGEMPDKVSAGGQGETPEGHFLRTGDMGFMYEGQLYVTGREDDLLIVRGMNHHPQDLESTASKSHPLLEAGFGAAFAVKGHGAAGEPSDAMSRLVLVQEVARNGQTDYAPVLACIREAVLIEHGLTMNAVVLVRSGTIPKTSSGKVQRRACRVAFEAGDLKVLAEYKRPVPGKAVAVTTVPASACPTPHAPQSPALAAVCQHALSLSGVSLSDVTPDTPLTALGLDSLQRVELAAALEKTFACRLPDTAFSPTQTLGELAQTVQDRLKKCSSHDVFADHIPPAHYDFVSFPEYVELKQYERMLKAVAGDNPYFRVDQGGTSRGSVARVDGRDMANFCVYDYVGMAHDPAVIAASKAAIDHYGTGAGASRLVSGEKQVHRDLEQALAQFLGAACAIAFVSGHATNVTTIGHLMGPEDLVVHDVLAHNSIVQGAQLSGATRRVFAHNDWQAMDAMLTEMRHRYRRALIAIEGVYSMDGDFPDLPRFVELKKKHKALLLVDEAHSLGTMGATGRGIGEHWSVARADVDMWMGTLSKSLASCGGYIAGSAELVEYLRYTAPGFVYSVGISPSNAAAALAALRVLQAEPQRVTHLRRLGALFLVLAKARGLNVGFAVGTPVIPVIIGNSVKSLRLAHALFDRGINVLPILYPAVPESSARLRFFITINHSEAQIRGTVNAIADELARL